MMPDADQEALTLALECARGHSAARAGQLDDMLTDGEHYWREVAEFAAYCSQRRALNLKVWESPPCCYRGLDLAHEHRDGAGQPLQAVALLREMRAHGISDWHPDPLAAIKAAKAKATA